MYTLPMIAPRADASLWPSHRANYQYYEETSTSPPNTGSRRPSSRHGHSNHHHYPRTAQSAMLAALTQDENTIEQRKLNVRRFGAGWLRPPGVAKTLQAMRDEELEKEEQELMARREQVMMDLAAAQQEAANAEAREQDGAEDQEQEERDLDDDVPEAEATPSEGSLEDSSDIDASHDGGNDTTVPFNEDSFIEGSMLEAEVSHMLEMEEAEMAGVLQDERDLDDDIPEAGSYEHTDSELEASTDDDTGGLPSGLMSSARSQRRSARRESGRRVSTRQSRRSSGYQASGAGAGGYGGHGGQVGGRGAHLGPPIQMTRGIDLGVDLGHGRSSFGLDGSSSILEGSSFLRSSPTQASAPRGNLRDRFLGVARGSGSNGGGARRA